MKSQSSILMPVITIFILVITHTGQSLYLFWISSSRPAHNPPALQEIQPPKFLLALPCTFCLYLLIAAPNLRAVLHHVHRCSIDSKELAVREQQQQHRIFGLFHSRCSSSEDSHQQPCSLTLPLTQHEVQDESQLCHIKPAGKFMEALCYPVPPLAILCFSKWSLADEMIPLKKTEPDLPMYRTLLTPTAQDKSTNTANILYCTNTLKCAVLKNNRSTNICCYKNNPLETSLILMPYTLSLVSPFL